MGDGGRSSSAIMPRHQRLVEFCGIFGRIEPKDVSLTPPAPHMRLRILRALAGGLAFIALSTPANAGAKQASPQAPAFVLTDPTGWQAWGYLRAHFLTDTATGCQWIVFITHQGIAMAPRIAGDGKSHAGCREAK